VKQEYDARSVELGTAEKRYVDQAMTDSEDKAKAIIAAVTSGKTLEDAAKQVLEYIGTGAAEASYLKYDSWDVAVANGAQVPTYNSVQTASVQAISSLKGVAQFGDRDTAPPMATALETAILSFIATPTSSNAKSLQSSLASQAKSIFGH